MAGAGRNQVWKGFNITGNAELMHDLNTEDTNTPRDHNLDFDEESCVHFD